jgi:hypothetical protein
MVPASGPAPPTECGADAVPTGGVAVPPGVVAVPLPAPVPVPAGREVPAPPTVVDSVGAVGAADVPGAGATVGIVVGTGTLVVLVTGTGAPPDVVGAGAGLETIKVIVVVNEADADVDDVCAGVESVVLGAADDAEPVELGGAPPSAMTTGAYEYAGSSVMSVAPPTYCVHDMMGPFGLYAHASPQPESGTVTVTPNMFSSSKAGGRLASKLKDIVHISRDSEEESRQGKIGCEGVEGTRAGEAGRGDREGRVHTGRLCAPSHGCAKSVGLAVVAIAVHGKRKPGPDIRWEDERGRCWRGSRVWCSE